MSPSVRAVVVGAAAPAVALGWEGGRVLVSVARAVPVPGRAGLEQAAAATVSTVAGTVASALDVLVPSVASAVLSRLDLTAVVTEQVDLDAVVREVDIEAVIDRLDLTALVRERVDLDAIVREVDIDAVIDRLDLTALVRERVDLDAIVSEVDIDAVAGRIDIDAVIARVDLVGLAQEVMDALDLPAIIRGSTASVASESVQDVRLQTIAADDAVSRVVDRLLLRRRHRMAAPNGVEHPLLSPEPDPTAGSEAIPVQREVGPRSPQP